jgi:hypothetical protein
MLMYNSIIISDSDRTITYQIQARDPRPHCVSPLERAHKLFGLRLHPQPNTVIIYHYIINQASNAKSSPPSTPGGDFVRPTACLQGV